MSPSAFSRVHRGFTLIEILIVIAIIATLASIAYPFFTSYMENARAMESRKHCTDIANAIENFKRDNNSLWPLRMEEIGSDEETIILTTEPGKDFGLLEILAAREKSEDRLNINKYSYIRGDVNESARNGLYENAGGELGFYDPWGNPYTVLISDSEDDGIADPFTGKATRKQVLVYGNGKDGKALPQASKPPTGKSSRGSSRARSRARSGSRSKPVSTPSMDETVNADNVYSWKTPKS